MIDDMDRNLEAARALGMQTVRFGDRDQCAAELSLLLQEPFELTASQKPS
jgi:FMN phosphatase YigB (HAD superfamily)